LFWSVDMTTRAGLRALARGELNDAGGTPLWTDAQLNQWLLEAIRRYSEDFPKAAEQTIPSVADQASYSLAADCLRVARVEHPQGFFRIEDPLSAGDVTFDDPSIVKPLQPMQLAYEIWGAHGARTLTLRPAPADASDSIVVRYLATWAEPAADGDTLATPARDDQLLVWLICSAALWWISTDEAKRQRFERDRGASTQDGATAYKLRYEAEVRLRSARSAPRRLVVRG
jgi:hypothetical protein